MLLELGENKFQDISTRELHYVRDPPHWHADDVDELYMSSGEVCLTVFICEGIERFKLFVLPEMAKRIHWICCHLVVLENVIVCSFMHLLT